MTECIPHPDDPSRWLPVDEAIGDLWRDRLAALALIEAHDARLAEQNSALSDAVARLDAQDEADDALMARVEKVEALTARVDGLAAALSTLTATVAGLRADFDALRALVGPASGIDASKYQTVDQIKPVLAGRPDFCIINATTGIKTTSPALGALRDASRANADITGYYHWSQTINDAVSAEKNYTDPVGECAWFLSQAQPKVGELVTLDHEQALGTWAQRVVYAIDWLEECRRRTGARPLIYLNWSWIQGLRSAATLAQWERLVDVSDVWLADPSGTPGKHDPVSPKAGSSKTWRVLVHQYAVIDNVDRNWTPDLAALRAGAVKFLQS